MRAILLTFIGCLAFIEGQVLDFNGSCDLTGSDCDQKDWRLQIELAQEIKSWLETMEKQAPEAILQPR